LYLAPNAHFIDKKLNHIWFQMLTSLK